MIVGGRARLRNSVPPTHVCSTVGHGRNLRRWRAGIRDDIVPLIGAHRRDPAAVADDRYMSSQMAMLHSERVTVR